MHLIFMIITDLYAHPGRVALILWHDLSIFSVFSTLFFSFAYFLLCFRLFCPEEINWLPSSILLQQPLLAVLQPTLFQFCSMECSRQSTLFCRAYSSLPSSIQPAFQKLKSCNSAARYEGFLIKLCFPQCASEKKSGNYEG